MEELSVAEHNQAIANSHCIQACLCGINVCECNNKYSNHCEPIIGGKKLWIETHHLEKVCKAEHSKPVYMHGASCLNNKCIYARLEDSSWCISCLAAYKTSKGEKLPAGEYPLYNRHKHHEDKLALARSKRAVLSELTRREHQENRLVKLDQKTKSNIRNIVDEYEIIPGIAKIIGDYLL